MQLSVVFRALPGKSPERTHNRMCRVRRKQLRPREPVWSGHGGWRMVSDLDLLGGSCRSQREGSAGSVADDDAGVVGRCGQLLLDGVQRVGGTDLDLPCRCGRPTTVGDQCPENASSPGPTDRAAATAGRPGAAGGIRHPAPGSAVEPSTNEQFSRRVGTGPARPQPGQWPGRVGVAHTPVVGGEPPISITRRRVPTAKTLAVSALVLVVLIVAVAHRRNLDARRGRTDKRGHPAAPFRW